MRKLSILAAVSLVVILALLASQPSAPSFAGEEQTSTATLGPIRLPQVFKDPTKTATPGPIRMPLVMRQNTRTATPTVTATNPPISSGLTGSMVLRDNKPTYATYIENIFFYENIFNGMGSTIRFGILGVAMVESAQGAYPFRTSWDGAGAPGGQLEIYAGCHGPAGIPCASSADAGRHEDHVGDGSYESTVYEIRVPGQYKMQLFVCYSTYDGCQQAGGVWQPLGNPVQFVAVHWTPSPFEQFEPTPAPRDRNERVCYLITDDPRGMYLQCSGKEARGRPLSR